MPTSARTAPKEIDYSRARRLLSQLGSAEGGLFRDIDWLAQQLCGGPISTDAALAEVSGTYEYITADQRKAEEIILSPDGVYTVEIYRPDHTTVRYAGAYRIVTDGGRRIVKTVDVNTARLEEFSASGGEHPQAPIHLEPQDAEATPAQGQATTLTFTKPDGTVHVFHRL